MYMRLLHMHGILGGGVAPPGMFFCVAAQIVTFVATERCQPPTIARKMICGSPCSALTHHPPGILGGGVAPPGNVCYCFVLGP